MRLTLAGVAALTANNVAGVARIRRQRAATRAEVTTPEPSEQPGQSADQRASA